MNENLSREKEVYNALMVIGVVPHIKGFEYLKQAILLVLSDKTYLQRMTGSDGVYGVVAKLCDATPSAVERCIRHAIEDSIHTLTADELYMIFRNTLRPDKVHKICNSHYIAAVVNVLEYEPEKFMKGGKR